MVNQFERAFEIVVGLEGGYVNDPRDPGGETNWGISKRSYPALDIPSLTREQAKSIYKSDYWDKIDGDSRPWGPALVMFDCAVNQGVAFALRAASIAGSIESPDFEESVTTQRLQRYAANPNYGTYGKGWTKRALKTFRLSLSSGETQAVKAEAGSTPTTSTTTTPLSGVLAGLLKRLNVS